MTTIAILSAHNPGNPNEPAVVQIIVRDMVKTAAPLNRYQVSRGDGKALTTQCLVASFERKSWALAYAFGELQFHMGVMWNGV